MSYYAETTYKGFQVFIEKNVKENYIRFDFIEPNTKRRFSQTFYPMKNLNKTLAEIEELFNDIFYETVTSSYYYCNEIVEHSDKFKKITRLILEIHKNNSIHKFSFISTE